MKSRIKTFNPIVINNRLVPKKDNERMEVPRYEESRSNLIILERQISKKQQYSPNLQYFKIERRPQTNSHTQEVKKPYQNQIFEKSSQPSYQNKVEYISNSSEGWYKKVQLTTSRETGDHSNDTSSEKEQRSTENNYNKGIERKIVQGKQKLLQLDTQLSFYERVKDQNNKILKTKYSEISKLKQTVEGLLSDKQKLVHEIKHKNKRIEEVETQNFFKEKRIMELQKNDNLLSPHLKSPSAIKNGKKRRISQIDDNCLSISIIKQNQRLEEENNQKMLAIEQKYEKIVNDLKEEKQKVLLIQEQQYLKKIKQIQRMFADEQNKLQNKLITDFSNKIQIQQKAKVELKSLYDKKIIELKQFYEKQATNQQKNLSPNSVIQDLKIYYNKEKQIFRNELQKEKKILIFKHQQQLAKEQQKNIELSEKVLYIQIKIQEQKTLLSQKQDNLNNFKEQLNSAIKQKQDMKQIVKSEKNKYLRMENLWGEEKKNNEANHQVIQKLQKVNHGLLDKIKDLGDINALKQSLQSQVNEMRENNEKQEQEVRKINQQNRQIVKQNMILNEKVMVLENQKKEQQKQMNQKKEQLQFLKKDNENQQEKLKLLFCQIAQMKKQILQKMISQEQQVCEIKNENLQEQLKNSLQKMQKLQKQTARLSNELNQLVDESIEHQSEILHLKRQLSHKTQLTSLFQESKIEIEQLKKQIAKHKQKTISTIDQYIQINTVVKDQQIQVNQDQQIEQNDLSQQLDSDQQQSDLSDENRVQQQQQQSFLQHSMCSEQEQKQNLRINELLCEVEQKQFIIEEMDQCISDYKQMVWEMKKRLQLQQNSSQHYKDILEIFNIDYHQFDENTHGQLIDTLNSMISTTKQVPNLLMEISELKYSNEELKEGKRKIMKQLKKCKLLMEKFAETSDQLENRLSDQIVANSDLKHQIRKLEHFIEELNQQIITSAIQRINLTCKQIHNDYEKQLSYCVPILEGNINEQ